jgi:hypothetical protein
MSTTRNDDCWSFSNKDIFEKLGFTPAEGRVLQSCADEFTEAVVLTFHAHAEADGKAPLASATATLFVAGKQYYISLSKAAKEIAIDAARIIGVAVLLRNLRILDCAVTISVRGLVSLMAQTTRLSKEQQRTVLKILELKHASGSRTYWPTTKKLARVLKLSQKRIAAILTPINGKVVALDPDNDVWRVLW